MAPLSEQRIARPGQRAWLDGLRDRGSALRPRFEDRPRASVPRLAHREEPA